MANTGLAKQIGWLSILRSTLSLVTALICVGLASSIAIVSGLISSKCSSLSTAL